MAEPTTERLALFPLGLVLFPGLVLPLHIFEERYRALVRSLLERPEPQQRFGVVALREGREVGADGVRALHEIGCVAQVRRVQAYPDGRYDVVSIGAERFRLGTLDHDLPFVTSDVELLAEPDGDPAEAGVLHGAVVRAYGAYRAALTAAGAEDSDDDDDTDGDDGGLPADPTQASYVVAATMLLDLDVRQSLLAAQDTRARLRSELHLLRRETTLLRTLSAVPAPELARTPLSLN